MIPRWLFLFLFFAGGAFVWWRANKVNKSKDIIARSDATSSAANYYALIFVAIICLLHWLGVYDKWIPNNVPPQPILTIFELFMAHKWLLPLLIGVIVLCTLIVGGGLKDENGNWRPWKFRLSMIALFVLIYAVAYFITFKPDRLID